MFKIYLKLVLLWREYSSSLHIQCNLQPKVLYEVSTIICFLSGRFGWSSQRLFTTKRSHALNSENVTTLRIDGFKK